MNPNFNCCLATTTARELSDVDRSVSVIHIIIVGFDVCDVRRRCYRTKFERSAIPDAILSAWLVSSGKRHRE
jgi:hypothetical protein